MLSYTLHAGPKYSSIDVCCYIRMIPSNKLVYLHFRVSHNMCGVHYEKTSKT